MADDERPEGEGTPDGETQEETPAAEGPKVTDVAFGADVTKDTGETTRIEGGVTITEGAEEAEVTPISEAPSATREKVCIECETPLTAQGRCINADCSIAQSQWSVGAGRATMKATAVAAAGDRPRAWTSSGRVD